MRLVLYQLPPMAGLSSLSPFCVKVQLALKLKRIPFEVVNTFFPRESPHNKVPFVVWGERRLEDSTAIIEAIDAEVPEPRLIPLDPLERAEADVLEDWADESLYWHGVAAKFQDEGWARVKPGFTAAFPAALRLLGPTIARRQTLAKLDAQGLSRRAPALVLREFTRHLDSLEAKLAGKKWLVGESISIADLAVTAMLGQLHEGVAPTHAALIAGRPSLTALIRAVNEAAKA